MKEIKFLFMFKISQINSETSPMICRNVTYFYIDNEVQLHTFLHKTTQRGYELTTFQ